MANDFSFQDPQHQTNAGGGFQLPPLQPLASPEIQPYLAAGERVLWEGRPQGIVMSGASVAQGCFGGVFAGFALFWMSMAFLITSSASRGFQPFQLFPLFGLIFFFVGVGMIWSALVSGPRRRGSGRYAVTDRRILFLTIAPRMQLKELPITPALRLELNANSDGSGTIEFMDPVSVQDMDGMAYRSRRYGPGYAYRQENYYTFYKIADAVEVHRLISNLIASTRPR